MRQLQPARHLGTLARVTGARQLLLTERLGRQGRRQPANVSIRMRLLQNDRWLVCGSRRDAKLFVDLLHAIQELADLLDQLLGL